MTHGWFGPSAMGVFKGWPSCSPRRGEGWLCLLAFVVLFVWANVGWGLSRDARLIMGILDIVVFAIVSRLTYVDDGQVY